MSMTDAAVLDRNASTVHGEREPGWEDSAGGHDRFGIVLLCLCAAAVVAVNFLVRIAPGDDIVNIHDMQQYDWLSWIHLRYMSWSGRITNEAVGYIALHLGVWFYWLTNPLFVFLAAWSSARIFSKKPSARQLACSLLCFSLMNMATQASAIYWISGSYGYIMPVAFGLYAMIPFADSYLRGEHALPARRFALSLGAAFMVSLGNEPAALVTVCFAVLYLAARLVRRERVSPKFFVIAAVMAAGTTILLLAPGSAMRWQIELRWFPGFDRLTAGMHAKISAAFLFDALINRQTLLLLGLSAVPFFFYRRYRGLSRLAFWAYSAVFFSFVATKLVFGARQATIVNLTKLYDFSFYKDHYDAALSLTHLLPYAYCGVYLALLIYLVCVLCEHRWAMLLTFCAAGASLLVITFSPTIYASGSRVLLVCSVSMALILLRFLLPSRLLRSNLFLLGAAMLACVNVAGYATYWVTHAYTPLL